MRHRSRERGDWRAERESGGWRAGESVRQDRVFGEISSNSAGSGAREDSKQLDGINSISAGLGARRDCRISSWLESLDSLCEELKCDSLCECLVCVSLENNEKRN